MSDYKQEHGYVARNAGGFFAGLLMGGLIGSGAMLLWAPQSGKKTRAQIRQESSELHGEVVDTAEGAVTQARGKAKRVAARVHKQTKKLQKRGQDMVDEKKDVVSDVLEAGKKAVHNISSG